MRALRDMNLPKFVFEDVPLFLGLIADLFPGLDCPRVRYPNFNDAVEAVLVDNKYVLLPHQVTQTQPRSQGLDPRSPQRKEPGYEVNSNAPGEVVLPKPRVPLLSLSLKTYHAFVLNEAFRNATTCLRLL